MDGWTDGSGVVHEVLADLKIDKTEQIKSRCQVYLLLPSADSFYLIANTCAAFYCLQPPFPSGGNIFQRQEIAAPATNLAAGQEPSSFQLLLLRFKARNPCHILFYGLHGKKFATISCCRQETAATSAHALEGKNLLRSSTACQRLFATWSSQFFLPPTQPLVQENAADAFRSWPGKNLLRGKSQRLKTCQHFFCNVCTSSMADLTFEK